MHTSLPILSKTIANATRIITHPGKAHRDEVLSIALIVALRSLPVYRRIPTEEEINDPSILVLDVGGVYAPQLGSFDHHQFNGSQCTLTLILRELRRYDIAQLIWPWLSVTEKQDTQGVADLAKDMGVSSFQVISMMSPVEQHLLSSFSRVRQLGTSGPLMHMLAGIGRHLHTQLDLFSCKVTGVLNNSHVLKTPSGRTILKICIELEKDLRAQLLHAFIMRTGIVPDIVAYISVENSNWLLFAPVGSKIDVLRSKGRGIVKRQTLNGGSVMAITTHILDDEALLSIADAEIATS